MNDTKTDGPMTCEEMRARIEDLERRVLTLARDEAIDARLDAARAEEEYHDRERMQAEHAQLTAELAKVTRERNEAVRRAERAEDEIAKIIAIVNGNTKTPQPEPSPSAPTPLGQGEKGSTLIPSRGPASEAPSTGWVGTSAHGPVGYPVQAPPGTRREDLSAWLSSQTPTIREHAEHFGVLLDGVRLRPIRRRGILRPPV